MGHCKISSVKRRRIYDRDGNRCRRCGRGEPEVRLEIDHILPRSKGGTNIDSNLQTLCQACNNWKLNHGGEGPEAVIARWCEETFGPSITTQHVNKARVRSLLRRLNINSELREGEWLASK